MPVGMNVVYDGLPVMIDNLRMRVAKSHPVSCRLGALRYRGKYQSTWLSRLGARPQQEGFECRAVRQTARNICRSDFGRVFASVLDLDTAKLANDRDLDP